MMNHDPFQNYQTLAAFGGGISPYGLPFGGVQQSYNPIGFAGQQLTHPSQAAYGNYPQQLQGGIQQGQWQQPLGQNPFAFGQQNPMLQHPLAHAALQNPLLAQSLQVQNPLVAQSLQQNPLLAQNLQNPFLNPMLAYQGWPQQQTQFGYPLAPQSLIGAGGIGQPYGQINPLAQLALRQASGYGISPWAGF